MLKAGKAAEAAKHLQQALEIRVCAAVLLSCAWMQQAAACIVAWQQHQ